jgi:hypothetical protein
MESLYVRIRGEVLGPLGLDEARAVFDERKLTPSHEVSYDGSAWFPAGQIWSTLRSDSLSIPAVARSAANSRPKSHKPTVEAPPPPLKPPAVEASSTVDAPPEPSLRRPPSGEMSAAARTPTAEEMGLHPAPLGYAVTALSILLPPVIIAELVGLAMLIHYFITDLELIGELSLDTFRWSDWSVRAKELESSIKQTSFVIYLGMLMIFAFIAIGFTKSTTCCTVAGCANSAIRRGGASAGNSFLSQTCGFLIARCWKCGTALRHVRN